MVLDEQQKLIGLLRNLRDLYGNARLELNDNTDDDYLAAAWNIPFSAVRSALLGSISHESYSHRLIDAEQMGAMAKTIAARFNLLEHTPPSPSYEKQQQIQNGHYAATTRAIENDEPKKLDRGKCRDCGCPVIFCVTKNGKKFLLDETETTFGKRYRVDGHNVARFVHESTQDLGRMCHWETCSAKATR